jgi:hypothetical protein
MRTLLCVSSLCLMVSLVNAQQSSTATHPAAAQTIKSGGVSAEDAQALRADLQRMKALVQQMQTNLAFVTNTQGPLKHQFELEIEMWQLEIASMERRLRAEPGKQ